MTTVKNLAGLAIVLGMFIFAFLFSLGLAIFGLGSVLTLNISIYALAASVVSVTGLFITGWVLYLFATNFSWNDLLQGELLISRNEAPVAIEVTYDNEKSRRYLVDSRLSPRGANPAKLGRGVFLMKKKRGELMQDKTVITLRSADVGTKLKDIRAVDNKIVYTDVTTGKTHQIAIASINELSVGFGGKTTTFEIVSDPSPSTETDKKSKPNATEERVKLAAAWAKALGK